MSEEINSFLSLFHVYSQILEGEKGPYIQTFAIILFVLLFNFIIRLILHKLSTTFINLRRIWALSFVTALERPLKYLVWYIALLCAIDIFVEALTQSNLPKIHILISAGTVLAFGWFLLRWNNAIVQNILEESRKSKLMITPGKLDLINKLATIGIVFITVFLLMDVTGRSVQTLIAFGGIGGLALAFASQQVVANFFGGLMVYITRPFTIGEWVSLPEKKVEGHIEEIGWYLTCIRSFEKRPIYVPNSIFTQNIVITPSRMSHERFHHTIGLSYNDIDIVQPIIDKIKQMLINHSAIDHTLIFDVFFKGFGLSALDIEISAYISLTTDMRVSAIKQDLLLKIAAIIKEENGEIAISSQVLELYKFDSNTISRK